jgi:hypothetical protein
MSVLMTLRVNGDPKEVERRVANNPEGISSILEQAKAHGLIAHRFYGSDDGQLLVIDEWPDAESFQRFFESTSDEIGPMMQEVGATQEPEIRFWRKLDTNDDYGWDA